VRHRDKRKKALEEMGREIEDIIDESRRRNDDRSR